jgi:glutaredoxin 3
MPSKVLIYTSPFCAHCHAALALLAQKGVDVDEINVAMVPGAREDMVEKSGRRSVPQIFIGGEHIGGNNELRALDISGELDKRLGLKTAPAI